MAIPFLFSIRARNYFSHEDYDPKTKQRDVGLVELNHPFPSDNSKSSVVM